MKYINLDKNKNISAISSFPISNDYIEIDENIDISYYEYDKNSNELKINVDKFREKNLIEINNTFKEKIIQGTFKSKTLNKNIYCRRNNELNDIQDLEIIINRMIINNLDKTKFYTIDGVVYISLDQGKEVLEEMRNYFFELNNKKNKLIQQNNLAKTIEEFKNITWV